MARVKWYNYLIGLVIIIVVYLGLSWILFQFTGELLIGGRFSSFIAINTTFALFLIISLIVTKVYNRVPITSIINNSGKIKVKEILWGIAIWTTLLGVSLIITLVTNRENLEFNSNIKNFIYFIILSAFLTPFQILSEEYIFRGYLIRLLEGINKNRIFLILVSSTIFALLHMSNPEVKEDKILFLLVYLTMALFLTVLTIKRGGMEYSIGIHFANNFFAINFLNYPDSPLPSFPLFLSLEEVSPLESLISLVVIISITTGIIFLKDKYDKKRNFV